MDTRVRSESWSNLRSLSVRLKVPSVPHTADDVGCNYLQDVFETERKVTEEKEWNPDPLSCKSYSNSTLLQRSTILGSNPCSADTTPQTRRKSVKRIIERFSTHHNSANSIVNTDKLNVPSNHRKTSKNHKRDSVYFNLYMDAVEQSILTEDDLKVWKIQEHFPNDDLKFYEGIFTINSEERETSETQLAPYSIASASVGPGLTHLTMAMGVFGGSTKNEGQDEEVHLEPQAIKIKKIASAKIYESKNFTPNSHRRKDQHTSDVLSQLPTFSNLSPGLQAKFKKMAQRRQSAPSIVLRGVLGKSSKLPASLYGRDESTPYSPSLNSQRLSLKFGSHGATLNLSKRKYIMEGKVQLTTGMQTQDRYMFLFTDLLLIAKAKSGSNFKLKYRIRVCELWIASCLDEVCEIPKASDQSFVIGWPTANCVATFSTTESKERWLNALIQQIEEEKEKETPKTTTLRVTSRDSSNINQVKSITVSHKHTAKDVTQLAIKEFNFENNEDDYQLWVTSRKEATAYPLIGHENPHAIQISQIRDIISANGILPETEITSVARYENLIQSDARHRCHFILRSSRQSSNKFNVDMTQRRMTRIKAKTPAAFFNWARKRNGQRNESSDSGHASLSGNSAGSDVTTYFSSSPPSTSPPATPKLFSLPLGQVCHNGVLPDPITLMIDILYRKAPYANGIFRKSANAKTTRLLKHKLDDESDVTINDASIHVIAALVKDFLRNIPDSVLDSSLYSEWTAASDLESEEEKITTFRNLLRSLDECNRVLMRRLAIVLNRIASRAKCNNMTSYNLAVCIAPSLLWPPGPALQTDVPIKVTQILQFLTDRCGEIFDGLVPTDMNWPPEVELKSESDENDEYEGDNEKSTGTIDEPLSPSSDIATSQDNDLENEEKEEDVNHFSRSRMIRRQLQRRKPGSKVEAARRMSLSQDSLDRVLNDDEALTPNVQTLDDMILTGELHPHQRARRRGHHRGTDACSMSNDSGFTTLSGEDEDDYAKRTSRNHPNILLSLSTGSHLNELEENIRRTSEELKNLWEPKLLKISNGEIIEEDEYKDEEAGMEEGGFEEDNAERPTFVRRQSQPVLSRRQRLHASSVNSRAAQNRRFHITSASSRLVEAITSPSIEYDESDDDEISFTQFRPQPPTYVRLNDNKENEPEKSDGLAKEYLRKLRKLSTDDVTETIAKSVTSAENKKQYLSGVTVKVNDVRPPEQKQYRPVTLSLCGINTDPVLSLPEKDGSSTISENNQFYIGENFSTGSTPDAVSSQEDVFNDYNFTPVRNKSSSDIPEAPKTAPLSRKFNSARSHDGRDAKLISPLTPQPRDISTEQCLSPIRKLTENLNMIPDFRQQKGISDFNNSFTGRRKASSVREGSQMNRKNDFSTHFVKSKKHNNHLKSDDTQGLIGTSFKADPVATSSRSSISDASRSSMESSSKSSSKEESTSSKKDATFDRDIRARRPYSRRRQNLLNKMTRNAEEGSFTKSLPAGDWNKMKDSEHLDHEKESSSRESLKSSSVTSNGSDVIYSDVISRLNQPSPKLRETDIIHMAGAVESKIRELSNSSPAPDSKGNASPAQIHISPGSVKSKITAFNGLSTHSPKSHSSNSSSEDLLAKRRSGASPQLDSPTPSKIGILSSQCNHDVMKKLNNDVNQNGLVIRGPQEQINRNRLKESVSVQIHPPEYEKPSMTSLRRSPQSVSDNLIFSLSESFAFGNRKSPRSITPNGSPHDSPVFSRRRRNTEKRTTAPKLSASPQNITPIRRTRHMSVERYATPNHSRTNVHVTASSSRRKKNDDVDVVTSHTNGGVRVSLKNHRKPPPSPAVTARDRNSNEILSFAGLERVNHSEESYV